MYNPEYIAYMNEQIKKAENKLIEESLKDLEYVFYQPRYIDDYMKIKKKWEARKDD